MKMKYTRCFAILIALLIPMLGLFGWNNVQNALADSQTYSNTCHFALTDALGLNGYDMSSLGIGGYLNWGTSRPSSLPANIEHTKVLRVRDDVYPTTLNNLTATVQSNPDQVWIIGNEPDVKHGGQDNLLPEVYAARFYTLRNRIKLLDPDAKVGFGPISQPTPIRIRYLNRILDRLDDPDLAGSRPAALALIDIYTTHAFIVNEQPDSWGAGIPPGFDNDYSDAENYPGTQQSDFDRTHDINVFIERVVRLRQWMAGLGEQNKPLWITEYGSLLTPIPPPGYPPQSWNVPDSVTKDYMEDTFDFMLGTEGISTTVGYPGDDYRMVQRFYWYSLNEYRYIFGGSLFDPTTRQRTIVGDGYVNYVANPAWFNPTNQDVYVKQVTIYPLGYTPGTNKTRVDYRLEVDLSNYHLMDLLTNVVVEFSVDNTPVLPNEPLSLPRCGGSGKTSFNWTNVDPNDTYDLKIEADYQPYESETDHDLNNNLWQLTFEAYEPLQIFLPLIRR